ncbi:MAG: phosphoribosylamine--glycine ligase [Arcobacteraceae bacterium]|nr:phosphoribosylamine--glycine ligase [Arcobacteraceae bacterium]
MNILILGSGGREYSIGLAISKEYEEHNITFCPGNGATDKIGSNINIKDYKELASWAKNNNIGLTIVGPEQPLVDGVVDIFKQEGLTIFGPSAKAAQLEGSKVYMKNILKKYNIPTAAFIETASKEEAYNFIDSMSKTPIVVKADGLCAGKGVIIALSKEEAKEAVSGMLSGESFGDAGAKVVVEEYLDGYELSIFAVCDGDNYVVLPAAQDHKRVGDGDTGPNTGGMGAYAPTPLVNDDIYKKVEDRVIKPTLEGMKKEGAPFEGVLFIGVMVVDNEPIILEYNVRFGDPECEILMPLLETPVSELFYKGATKQLDTLDIKIKKQFGVAVVMASGNYPYGSSAPAEIIVDDIHDEVLKENSHISYAGVTKDGDTLLATGGRVLLCVGFGDDIQTARDRAYALCGQVHFAGKKCRTDIAYQALK